MNRRVIPIVPVRHDAVVLRDGRRVFLSPITPSARQVIADAVARMSPETSRRRFFTVRRHLSDPELDALTVLDGVDRYALGAVVEHADGHTEGVGVARYVRLPGDPRSAEVALVVMDDWQHAGLGSLLLREVAHYALTQGIERFTGSVLPESGPMIRLLLRFDPHLGRVGDHLEFDIPLARALAHATAA